IPPKLEEIINKALEKDRNLRYQHASDIRTDLQRLKRETESARLPAATAPALSKLRVKWNVAIPTALAVVMLALGGYLYIHRAPKLTEKDTVVLAEFSNTTGDPVFDGSLRQGLVVQLEQSPFLNIVSEQQIQKTLRLMAKPADTRLTPEIAHELCERTGSAAFLKGWIGQVGTRYDLVLSAINCANGELLASAEAQATDRDHGLDALGRVASDIRKKLGESLNSRQEFDKPLEQVTTSSLEALQALGVGDRLVEEGKSADAISSFQRAISLDPDFAMAYSSLGNAYANLGEVDLAANNTRNAYRLRERVSDKERLYIEAQYYRLAIGDLEKARQAYDLLAQTYPRDTLPLSELSVIYNALGQYARGLDEARRALKIDPPSSLKYFNVVLGEIYLNRLDEVRATVYEAHSKNVDSPDFRLVLYFVAFLQNDVAGMAEQVTWSRGRPDLEGVLLASEADTAAYSGHLERARGLSEQAISSAIRAGLTETAAAYEVGAALREAIFGDASSARVRATRALTLSAGRDVKYAAALALANTGDVAKARTLADDLAQRFPGDTFVKLNYLPTLLAQLALNRKDVPKAIESLQVAAPYELGTPGDGNVALALYPVYGRGEAYLATKQSGRALAEFKKILDQPGVVINEPIGALARLQLGRAYSVEGNTPKARVAYSDFLTLWKNADPDIPI